MSGRSAGTRSRDERGAVAVFTALLLTMLLVVAAFAVDLGMQRVVRRDMQALADVMALDLARQLDGRTGAAISGSASWSAAMDSSLARNADTLGATPEVEAELGTINTSTYVFTPLPSSSAVPTAVRVTAASEVGFAFARGTGGASRSALAGNSTAACFQVGSYLASINPAASTIFADLLKPLLGASTLNLAGYQGLATANLSVLDLISAPSIALGTVDQMLSASSITARDLFLAGATVLTRQGKTAEAQVLTAAAASVVGPVRINMADILGVDSGAGDAALKTQLNALDLLVGTVLLANGENLLALPNLQASLPSVGVTNTRLKIIEKARRACNVGKEARTSQISLQSDLKVQPSNSPLVNGGGTLLRLINSATGSPDATVSLHADIELAGARATLTKATCAPDTFEFDVRTDLAKLKLTGRVHIEGSVRATVLGDTGVDIPVKFDVDITADGSKPSSTVPRRGTLTIPPQSYQDPAVGADGQPIGSGDMVLPRLSFTEAAGSLTAGPVTVSVLGLPVRVPTADLLGIVNPIVSGLLNPTTGAVVSRIGPLVDPIVTRLNDIIVQLNAALGMNVAGADVYGLPRPVCNSPVLRG